jgi:hypothetical protein
MKEQRRFLLKVCKTIYLPFFFKVKAKGVPIKYIWSKILPALKTVERHIQFLLNQVLKTFILYAFLLIREPEEVPFWQQTFNLNLLPGSYFFRGII